MKQFIKNGTRVLKLDFNCRFNNKLLFARSVFILLSRNHDQRSMIKYALVLKLLYTITKCMVCVEI